MKKTILMSLITAPFLIMGCGGGSSSATTTTNAKITGTVPGTLIEAFCDNNYYEQVTSTQNGTNEHPFEIEVPTNTNCRLLMTTNENDPENRVITPIEFSNGSTMVLNEDVDLGNIPLELSYQNSDDKDGDHVIDTPLNVGAPAGISSNSNMVQDTNGNGMVDAYDDDDNDNTPNAYEDNDNDGVANLHDDDNRNGRPDYLDRDNQNENMDNNDRSDNDQNGNTDNNDRSGNDQNENMDNNDRNGNDQNGNTDNNDRSGNDQNENMDNNDRDGNN